MRNKFLITTAIIVTMASCTSKVETKTETVEVNKDSIKTVIESMERDYAKAMEEKNIDALMAYYADDIKSYDPAVAPSIGFEAVKKSIGEMFTNMPAKFKITMNSEDLIISETGDMVSENGTFAMADSTGAQMATGRFLSVFQKKDGKYKCVREVVMADAPAQAKAEDKK